MTLTHSRARYHTAPSSEDPSDDREARASGDEPYLSAEHIPAKGRTMLTHFILGCAILLPWNVLVNATPFFLSRMAGSPLHPTFSSYLTGAYTWTKLFFQFYCTFTSKQSSPSRRIYASVITSILLFTCLCVSTFVRGAPQTFFLFAVFTASSLAVSAGYLSTAVFAVSALFGRTYLQPVISGQAASAVVVSAVQVASSIYALRATSPKPADPAEVGGSDDRPEDIAARIFFAVSAIYLCITLVAHTWLTRQPFYKSIAAPLEQRPRSRVDDPDERTRLVPGDHTNISTEPHSHVLRVFRENLIFMFSLSYVFAVNLSVYPAVTARVRSVNGIHPLLFTALHILVMNVGDLAGRCSCSYPRLLVWSGKKILAMSLLRTLFVPLILFCNVDRVATSLVSPVVRSDVFFMLTMLAMGLTTGYVATVSLLAVSSLEHNPRLKGRREDVDVAAMLGGSCLALGLALGALTSFGIQATM